jgi:membrane-associated protease RseP (regulator of RpoE activity)
LQVPVNEGIRLGNVVDGMSAQRAGLEKDDVLVELGGKPLASWTDLQLALQDQRAGDEVALVFYRRAERKHMRMALARRPIPEMPWSAEKLAALVRERSAETAAKLEAALAGVTEAEAGFKPAKEEWSAKEVLAHLILGVRFAQYWLAELVGGQERWADDYAGNLPAGIQALLVAYPTLADLLLELKRSYQAEAAMIAALPADFPEKRKASYWRFAYNWLEPDYHLQEHLEQMAASIQKAKG